MMNRLKVKRKIREAQAQGPVRCLHPRSRTVRRQNMLVILVLAVWLGGGSSWAEKAPEPSSPQFATYVMSRVDDMYRGASSHGIMEMQIKTKHWTRSMSMESWSLGKEYSLVRILRPRKEKGTATLKAKDNLFIYLNKTGRTVKITSGMMGNTWMGSHFTNDDLIHHSRLSRDYQGKLAATSTAEGQKIYRFMLTAKRDAPVVWGKLEVTVRQSDLQPLEQIFFNEDGQQVRVLAFSEHQQVGRRVMPRKMVMRPLDGSGEHTTVRWKEIDFDVKLDPGFFSLQKLRSL